VFECIEVLLELLDRKFVWHSCSFHDRMKDTRKVMSMSTYNVLSSKDLHRSRT
jgi:hypothetical protein